MKNRKKVLVLGWDGYIGFPLTLRLLTKTHVVYAIDNYSRRANVEEMGSLSVSPISTPQDRRELLYKIGNFTHWDLDLVKDFNKIDKLIKRHKFDVIVNLAHNPSAPYSMVDKEHANYVLINNIIGTNNILWSIKEHCPDCHYVTIGSTGEYEHDISVPIAEGYFEFMYKGNKSKESIFPRRANSIYHASKISSTYMIDYLTRLWDLKATDIMQSIVFGLYTEECDRWKEYTRFDIDNAFGTVINRFIVQTLINRPMTVFGHGKHKRAFLSLNDSIQALMIAIDNPPKSGKARVWNQLSEWASINDIANLIKDVLPNGKIRHIPSPRKEYTGGHFYKYETNILESFGYSKTRSIKDEISYISKTIKINNIDKLNDVFDKYIEF